MENKNIFLIGFMGVGKSTIARMLAKATGGKLIEMDETIEQEAGMAISAIFEKYGETYFRDLESALIARIAGEDGVIVSCGGGAVLREANVEKMKERGLVIFLSADPKTIYNRVRNSTSRPLLNGNMNVEYIAELMEKRRGVYESAADVTIITDNQTKTEIVDKIKALCIALSSE